MRMRLTSLGTVETLVVRSDWRRRGVGEALLEDAKGLAAERGFVRLDVEIAHVHAGEAGPFLLELDSSPGAWRPSAGKPWTASTRGCR